MWKALEKAPDNWLDYVKVFRNAPRRAAESIMLHLFRIPNLQYLLRGAALGGDLTLGMYGSPMAPLLALKFPNANYSAADPMDAALAQEVKNRHKISHGIISTLREQADDLIRAGYVTIEEKTKKKSFFAGRVVEVNKTVAASKLFLNSARRLSEIAVTVEHTPKAPLRLPPPEPANHITVRGAENIGWCTLWGILKATRATSVLLRGDTTAHTLQVIAQLSNPGAELSLCSDLMDLIGSSSSELQED